MKLVKCLLILLVAPVLLGQQTNFPEGVLVGDSNIGGKLDPSARLEVRGVGGVGIPNLTAAEIAGLPTPKSGLIVYNTTLNAMQFWDSVAWKTIGTPEILTPTVGATYYTGQILVGASDQLFRVINQIVFVDTLTHVFSGDLKSISPSDLTSTIYTGGTVSFSGANIDVTTGKGIIVNNNNGPFPIYNKRVSFNAVNGLVLPDPTSWNTVLSDSNGVVSVVAGVPTNDTFTSNLVLALVNGLDKSVVPLKGAALDQGNKIRDFFVLAGAMKSGIELGGNASKSTYVTAGRILYTGINPDSETPDIKICSAKQPVTFKLFSRSNYLGTETELNTVQYDSAGVLTTIGGTNWGYFYFYLDLDCSISIQYGQYTAPTLAEIVSVAAEKAGSFIVNPTLSLATTRRIGVVYFLNGATTLSNTSQAKFENGGIFGLGTAGTGSVAIPGDVLGPNPSTNNAIARFDGASGKVIKTSAATISDSGNLGVSNSAPNYKLDVNGGSNSGMHLKQASNFTATAGGFYSGVTLEDSVSTKTYGFGYGVGDTFKLSHYDGGLYKDLMVVAPALTTFQNPMKIGAYTLPSTDGGTGQVLKTDGLGNLTWATDNFASLTVGMVYPVSNPSCPGGTLLADGSQVSRATYAELFAAIGTTWGAGNGTTSFNLPDFRDKFLRGASATRPSGTTENYATARPTTAFTTDSLGAHNHTEGRSEDGMMTSRYGTFDTGVSSSHRAEVVGFTSTIGHLTSTAGAHSHTITGGGDSETRPVNVAIQYCVVYTGGSYLPGGSGAAGDVLGPGAALDSAVALFAGTTGKVLKPAPYTFPMTAPIAGQVLVAINNTTAEWGSGAGGGDVIGPTGSTDGNLVSFDGPTGKRVKDTAISASLVTHVNRALLDSLTNAGAVTDFLSADGQYRPAIAIDDNLTTQSAGNALSSNQGYVLNQKIIPLQAATHSHSNKPALDVVTSAGSGTSFLANNGTYKAISVTKVNDADGNTSIDTESTANNNRIVLTNNGTLSAAIESDGRMRLGNLGATPDTSAILDINTTTKGLKVPRVTASQMAAIPTPTKGLVVMNTDNSKFHFYNGVSWEPTGISEGLHNVGVIKTTIPYTTPVAIPPDASGVPYKVNDFYAVSAAAGMDGKGTINLIPGPGVTSVGTGDYIIWDGNVWSSVAFSDVGQVVRNGATTDNNLSVWDQDNQNVLKDSGIQVANVVTQTAAALSANKIPVSVGADKGLKTTAVNISATNDVTGVVNLTITGTGSVGQNLGVTGSASITGSLSVVGGTVFNSTSANSFTMPTTRPAINQILVANDAVGKLTWKDGSKACQAGYTLYSGRLCMSAQYGATNMTGARAVCGSEGAYVCKWTDFDVACNTNNGLVPSGIWFGDASGDTYQWFLYSNGGGCYANNVDNTNASNNRPYRCCHW